ncbi:MAG: hypothetical protein KAJ14_09365 [Candidatus Omnitrophica bacterium]|nr:hypothetical protein [Candidatus Omnitrophota bacterium]
MRKHGSILIAAAFYILGKQDSLTVQSPLFEDFGTTIETRREKYQEFLPPTYRVKR